MPRITVELDWYRYSKGYRLVPSESLAPEWCHHGDMIVPNGGDKIPCPPFEKMDTLCGVFAEIKTPGGLLDFVEKFGLLLGSGSISESEPFGDPVQHCLSNARLFRELFVWKEKGSKRLANFFTSELRRRRIADYEAQGVPVSLKDNGLEKDLTRLVGLIHLVPDPARGVRIQLTADGLMAALWWQLCEKLSGNTHFRECIFCKQLFEAGAGTGRRSDAEFCCKEHKVRYFSLRRSVKNKEI
jgi:hypothetical protein